MIQKKYKKVLVPVIAYLVILGVLLFAGDTGSKYLFVLLLFIPFLDLHWSLPRLILKTRRDLILVFACLLIAGLLLILDPDYIIYFVTGTIFTALPEEWFFRGYLLRRAGMGFRGNIIVSLGFSILHGISQNIITAFLVFLPSLGYGWVYQKTNNIYLVILLHSISNLIFLLYLREWLNIIM